jgi:hypothetical protein
VQLTLHDSPPGVMTHAHPGLATVYSFHDTTNTVQHNVYLLYYLPTTDEFICPT